MSSLPTGSSYGANMSTLYSRFLWLLISGLLIPVILQGCGIYDRSSNSILAETKSSFSNEGSKVGGPSGLESQVRFKYHLKGFSPADISYKIISSSRSRQEYQLLKTSHGLLEIVYIRTMRPFDIIDFTGSLKSTSKNWRVFNDYKLTWGKRRFYDSLSGRVGFRAARLESESVVCIFFKSEQNPLSKDHFDRPRGILIGYYCDLAKNDINLVGAQEILDAIELIGVSQNSYILGPKQPNPGRRGGGPKEGLSYVPATKVGYKGFPLNITRKAKLEGSVLKE